MSGKQASDPTPLPSNDPIIPPLRNAVSMYLPVTFKKHSQLGPTQPTFGRQLILPPAHHGRGTQPKSTVQLPNRPRNKTPQPPYPHPAPPSPPHTYSSAHPQFPRLRPTDVPVLGARTVQSSWTSQAASVMKHPSIPKALRKGQKQG